MQQIQSCARKAQPAAAESSQLVADNSANQIPLLRRSKRLAKLRVPQVAFEPVCTAININALSEDCMRLILNRLPLQEQIRLRIICRWWKTVIEGICHGKQSLKLFIGRDSLAMYLEKSKELLPFERSLQLSPIGTFNDDLLLNNRILERKIDDKNEYSKRQADSRFLIFLFSNINSLVISVVESYYSGYDKSTTFNLPQLLAQWPNLSTLVVTNFPSDKKLTKRQITSEIKFKIRTNTQLDNLERALWRMIIRMNSLTSLYVLNITNVRFMKCLPKPMLIAALSRLQQFTWYHHYDFKDNIDDYFKHMSQCDKLRICYFKNHCMQIAKPNKILPLFELPSNLSHLELTISPQLFRYGPFFSTISERLPSLTFLKTYFGCSVGPFIQTLTELAKLPHLTELQICFSTPDLLVDLPSQLPVLASLKTLYLLFYKPYTTKPTGQFYRALPRIFPNLEVVRTAALNSTIRMEVLLLFTTKSFPRLKNHLFAWTPINLYPSIVRFMGQHDDYVI